MTFQQKSKSERATYVSPKRIIPVFGKLAVSKERRHFLRRGFIIAGHRRVGAGQLIATMVMVPIGIAIGFLVTSAIVPTSIENMVAVNTTNWSTGTATLFDQIPLIGVIGIFVAIIGTVIVVVMR